MIFFCVVVNLLRNSLLIYSLVLDLLDKTGEMLTAGKIFTLSGAWLFFTPLSASWMLLSILTSETGIGLSLPGIACSVPWGLFFQLRVVSLGPCVGQYSTKYLLGTLCTFLVFALWAAPSFKVLHLVNSNFLYFPWLSGLCLPLRKSARANGFPLLLPQTGNFFKAVYEWNHGIHFIVSHLRIIAIICQMTMVLKTIFSFIMSGRRLNFEPVISIWLKV